MLSSPFPPSHCGGFCEISVSITQILHPSFGHRPCRNWTVPCGLSELPVHSSLSLVMGLTHPRCATCYIPTPFSCPSNRNPSPVNPSLVNTYSSCNPIRVYSQLCDRLVHSARKALPSFTTLPLSTCVSNFIASLSPSPYISIVLRRDKQYGLGCSGEDQAGSILRPVGEIVTIRSQPRGK